ncbi:MAG: hypothetical protein [Anelloviridae sp.]|nr:MAG: hypothetical protein [Anelloviridae sp.]
MPAFNFYRRRWYPRTRTYWTRRRWLRRRRPRKTIRRRFRRHRRVRRHFKRRFYKKKLSKITVQQWQPTTIKNCSIKGHLPLIICGQGRIPHNWTIFSESIVPVGESGGGAWSYTQLTLRALYDEFLKFNNWWTKGNDGLPLVRYRYTKLKLYRSKDTDYIVTIIRCPPFSVTRENYFDTQPSRMLMNINKHIIPRSDRKYFRKPYKTVIIKPPSLWTNKWYFQQDICNFPFFVIKASACSLDEFYLPSDQLTNNITLLTLNTDFFQNPQWKTTDTTPYIPKQALDTTSEPQQIKPVYLWGTHNGITYDERTNLPKTFENLTLLGNTMNYTPGKEMTQTNETNYMTTKANWGNPFHYKFRGTESRLFYTFIKPNTANTQFKGAELYYMFEQIRYNPLKDNGIGNTVYFKTVALSQGTVDTEPTIDQIIVKELPLWIIFWGFSDWIKKSKPIQHIDQDYQIVVKSKHLYPQRKTYLFTDKFFTHPPEFITELNETDKVNWHPKYDMQKEVENIIAQTGPAAPKITKTKSIQVNVLYNVKLKWGGCPAPMENVSNPCEQEKFPGPNSVHFRPEVTNPETEKETFLYEWDEKRQTITAPAAKRLKTDSKPKTYFTDSGPLNVPHEEETETQTSEDEEENKILLNRLLRNKRNRKLLRKRLRQLIK